MMARQSPAVIDASLQHTASLIFLHGLGDSGQGWMPAMWQLSRRFPFIRFICPHAPVRPVTLNGGMRMRAWYDLYSLEENDMREDEEGIRESVKIVLDLIKAERESGISNERIFIGGFSQGGAIALSTLLIHPKDDNREEGRFGGVISLSGYIPCRQAASTIKPPPLKTPIFMGHGMADSIVLHRWGQHSAAYLQSLGGKPVLFKSYPGIEHSTCEEELEDVADFIKAQLETVGGKPKDEL